MTKEEAIAIIENEKKCVNRANKNDYCNRDCYNCELVKTDTEILTALDIAIKALSAEPCEDAVSRKAVHDAVYKLCEEDTLENNPWRDNPHIDAITDAIDNIPSVIPKEKTGSWDTGYSFPDGAYWKCSCCGELIKVKFPMNYCNNCGAKMESEDKE